MNGNPVMLDTNLLIYAFDVSEGLKHELAHELLEKILNRDLKAAVSTQILSEFFANITGEKKKAGVNIPLPVDEAEKIIADFTAIDAIEVFELKLSSVMDAISLKKSSKVSYWDCLIASTMKENGILTIYTEDKGFEKIEGIKVVNPFHPT